MICILIKFRYEYKLEPDYFINLTYYTYNHKVINYNWEMIPFILEQGILQLTDNVLLLLCT